MGGSIRSEPYKAMLEEQLDVQSWVERINVGRSCIVSFFVLKISASYVLGALCTRYENPDIPDIDPDSPGGVSGDSGYSSGQSGLGCPDIPDIIPDIPDLVAKDSWLFDLNYAFCLLPWMIVL